MNDFLRYESDTIQSKRKSLQVLHEIWLLCQNFFLWLWNFISQMPPSREGTRRPVLLIAGLVGSTWSFQKLQRMLVEAGHPVYTLSFSSPFESLAKRAQKLEVYLEKQSITDCYIVGHSMGAFPVFGMSFRGRDRIRKLYAVGTPFKGSFLSYLCPITPARIDIIPGSQYLKNSERSVQTFSNYQALFSAGDEFIVPANNARPNRYDDVLIPEFGHMNLVMGDLGVEAITNLVDGEEQKDPLPQPQATKKKGKTGE